MASPFSDDPPSPGSGGQVPTPGSGGQVPTPGSGGQVPTPAEARPDAPPAEVSPAQARFLTCRWRKAAENGVPDHCGHRDVLPMAGATGFVPDAWCPDCQYFKAKRTPRKREEIERDRDRDWRW